MIAIFDFVCYNSLVNPRERCLTEILINLMRQMARNLK